MKANDKIKRKLQGKCRLDDRIRKGLKNKSHTPPRDSLIVQSLKRRKRKINPGYDVSRSIIYRLKEDYKKQNEPVLDVSDIDSSYQVLVNDESVQNPFIISSGLVKIIRKYTKHHNEPESKARAIFDWIERNIEYGTSKRTNGYKNSEEALRQREGVCGEMAFLYVTMARCVGLKSSYVSVNIDCKGESVHHACAVVDIGYRDIFVDPAYHSFDINHKSCKVLTDMEVLERFNQWRKPSWF